MGFETLLSAGASLGGALISSGAAGDAADAQAAGTAQANALQKQQYEETRKLLAPFVGTGTAANNKLAELLGIGGTPGGVSAAPQQSRDQLRESLLSKFTTQDRPGGFMPPQFLTYGPNGNNQDQIFVPGVRGSVDEAGLQKEIDRLYSAQPTGGGVDSNAEGYGSLLKDFTGADLASEPGYQFSLQQGQQGIDRVNASRGSLLSGAALKALGRFNTDYAGTKYNEAFNRDAASKTQKFNFLSGTSGTGQNAAAGTGTAGQTMANQVGANTTANANAQGASSIAQGNAWNGAFQGISNDYQQNNLLKTIMSGNSSWNTPAFGSGAAAMYDK